MIDKKLTDKQEMFCQEYLVDLNATQAAIKAGYSKKTAQQIASDNLSKVVIQNRIQELKEKRVKKIEVSAENTVNEIALLAFSDVVDYWDEDSFGRTMVMTPKKFSEMPEGASKAISGIEQSITKDGDVTYKVKLWDKPKSLEMLCRHLGIAKEQIEHGFDAAFGVVVAKKMIELEKEKV